jgi:hypothetical protein
MSRLPFACLAAASTAVVAGCAAATAYTRLNQAPVESEYAQVVVHEVRRGWRGAVAKLEIVNRAAETLEWVAAPRIAVQIDGKSVEPYSLGELNELLQIEGPAAIGLNFPEQGMAIVRQQMDERARLKPGQSTFVEVAFPAPIEAERATLDAAPALTWIRSDGTTTVHPRPLPAIVPLPHVEKRRRGPFDWFWNVHFGFVLTSG